MEENGVKAIYASVTNIKAFPSTGNCRVEVEIPVESYPAAVALLYGKKILITIAPELGLPFGVVEAGSVAEVVAPEPPQKSSSTPPDDLFCKQPAAEEAVKEVVVTDTSHHEKANRSLAQRMAIDGYFFNRRLWAAMDVIGLYTEGEHKVWIEQQECCGHKFENKIACQGDVVCHHVRHHNKDNMPAGGSMKASDFETVPLCDGHHMGWAHGSSAVGAEKGDREKLYNYAVGLTAERMREKMKEYLGLTSMSGITEQMVADFEEEIGLSTGYPGAP